MPEFFSFTLGTEANPQLPNPETSPLLVGRFRAVVPHSSSSASTPIAPPSPSKRPRLQRHQQQLQYPQQPQSASFLASRPGLLPSSRSSSPFLPSGGETAARHGFYNNTGYGAIATAGYYDGVGDDDEDDEDDEGDEEDENEGYDEDDEDEQDDDSDEAEEDDDHDNGTAFDDDYVDDASGNTAGGIRQGSSAANGHRRPGKALEEPLVPRRSRSRWWWLPQWGRQQASSPGDASGGYYRPLSAGRSPGSSSSQRRRSSAAAAASSPSQRYLMSQQVRQKGLRGQKRRGGAHIRRTRRMRHRYRSCGRRVARWFRRTTLRIGRHLRNLWITPKNATVRRAVDRWWTRWTLLVVLPAVVAIVWCSIPFPQYPLGYDVGEGDGNDQGGDHHRTPGHGEARVRINFWFFLFAYYGPYNMTALVWITKVFNLYSLNWWPSSLGFPLSVSLLAAVSLLVPAGVFFGVPPAAFLASHNTAWVTWTFAVMAMPVTAALLLLLLHERHRKLRHALSDTQRIFTSALWTGEPDTLPRRREYQNQQLRRQRHGQQLQEQREQQQRRQSFFAGRFRRGADSSTAYRDDTSLVDPLALSFDEELFRETSALLGRTPPLLQPPARPSSTPPRITTTAMASYRGGGIGGSAGAAGGAGHWLPFSFVRFLWLMSALFTSLLVYELGEASASIFLAALPDMHHATFYAVAYVYAWTVTVFLLDALTGWILGGRQGERVGSYPLGWVFKLYFMLTYQTYVRALYVRLRSPSQVVMLQVLSSTTLIVVTPLLMCSWTHRLLVAIGINGQTYSAFQKVCVRNVFVRFVAENASMLAFLGSLMVLHFGPNRDVYPYFAFDDDANNNGYTFSFTLYASSIAWACELVAAFIVSGLIRYFYGVSVVTEAKMDLAVWPELLPTSVAVSVHVLQNMLFSIIRLQFW